MYIIGIWKTNFCFAKPSAPKQLQGKYSTKWTDFLRRMVSGGNTLFAPAMLGCCSSFHEKSPDAIGTHCTIHCQALMVKIMPDELKSALNKVIKAVNLIKANSLNSCYLLIYAKKVIPNLKLFYCTRI